MGQCPHAPVGAITDVPESGLLSSRSVSDDDERVSCGECVRLSTLNSELPTSVEQCAASQANLTSRDKNPWSVRRSCGWRVPSHIADLMTKASSSPGLLVWDSGDYRSSILLAVISRCRTQKKPCG